jgi:predicted DNA-binding ribbon-helix-helix protein
MVKRYKSTMLEVELHQKIKELAVKKGTTINNLVREFADKESPCSNNLMPIQQDKKKIKNWWKI